MNGTKRVSIALLLSAASTLSAQSATGTKPMAGMGGMHAAHGVMYHSPQWSPDGKWILVSANREADAEVYLVRADGGELRQLTHNDVDDMARWSDDGQRVLFVSSQPGGERWFSMKADGSDVRPYSPDSVVSRSPDGKTLLFESVRNGRGRLFLMTSARTNPREIATARHAEQGSFAPDGKSIVFEQRPTMHDDIPHSQIVVSRPDGSEPRTVAIGTDPHWSRDGSLILFKQMDDATQTLWVSTVSPNGNGLKRLAAGTAGDGRRATGDGRGRKRRSGVAPRQRGRATLPNTEPSTRWLRACKPESRWSRVPALAARCTRLTNR